MKISAKTDYAVRAAAELAAADEGRPVKGEALATAQSIPLKFLENILTDLRRADLVRSQRGAEGGYWLARPAGEITVADVIRAVEGPLASVRGEGPESLSYNAGAEPLPRVRIAVLDSSRLTISCRCSVSRATRRQSRSCGPLIASASTTSGTPLNTRVASSSRPWASSSRTKAWIP